MKKKISLNEKERFLIRSYKTKINGIAYVGLLILLGFFKKISLNEKERFLIRSYKTRLLCVPLLRLLSPSSATISRGDPWSLSFSFFHDSLQWWNPPLMLWSNLFVMVCIICCDWDSESFNFCVLLWIFCGWDSVYNK